MVLSLLQSHAALYQVIRFYKFTPVAIFFAAAGIKVTGLYFVPGGCDLLCNGGDICRSDDDFFFAIIFLFVGLYKIKLSTDHFPVFSGIIVNKDLIKNSLPPVITAIGFFLIRAF